MGRQQKAQKKRREAEQADIDSRNSAIPGLRPPPTSSNSVPGSQDARTYTQFPPSSARNTLIPPLPPNSTPAQIPASATALRNPMLNPTPQAAALPGSTSSSVGLGQRQAPQGRQGGVLPPENRQGRPSSENTTASPQTVARDQHGASQNVRQGQPMQLPLRPSLGSSAWGLARTSNPYPQTISPFRPATQPTAASTPPWAGSRTSTVDMDELQRQSEQAKGALENSTRPQNVATPSCSAVPKQSNGRDTPKIPLSLNPPSAVSVKVEMPKPPGPRMIKTNYFNLTIGKIKHLYQYDLKVTLVENQKPQKQNRKQEGIARLKKRRIVQLLMKELADDASFQQEEYERTLATAKAQGNTARVEELKRDPIVPIPTATNYSTQIIAAGELKYLRDVYSINYYDEYQKQVPVGAQVYKVEIELGQIIDLTGFLQYLKDGPDSDSETTHNQIEAVTQALNIICSYLPYQDCFASPPALPKLATLSGKKFYGVTRNNIQNEKTATGFSFSKAGGLHSIPGFFRTIRAVFGNPGYIDLNINSTTANFYQAGNVQGLISAWKGYQTVDQSLLGRLSVFIHGVRGRTTFLDGDANLIVRVLGLADLYKTQNDIVPLARHCPMISLGSQVGQSVHEYYRAEHRLDVADDVYIVRVAVGGYEQTIPANLLDMLPGQMYTNNLLLPVGSVRPPKVNLDMIKPCGRATFFGEQAQCHGLRDFGINLSSDLVEARSFLLSPPEIVYRRSVTTGHGGGSALDLVPANALKSGAWNLRDKSLVKPAASFRWTVIEIVRGNNRERSDMQTCSNWAEELHKSMRRSSITTTTRVKLPSHFLRLDYDQLPTYHQREKVDKNATKIKSFLKGLGNNVNLVVFLLPTKDQELHASIKKAGDVDIGISTVCHVMGNDRGFLRPRSSDLSLLSNICLKINLKMGTTTVNQALQTRSSSLTASTMILGIDVTHPGNASYIGAPSVAAVVGSVDGEFAQWPASIRANPVAEKDVNEKQSMERVVDLKDMVLERLRCYLRRNNRVPERLLVYRDGLSEGQFDTCATQEYEAIQAARESLLDEVEARAGTRPAKPPILLLCAVKRHHTRLYPEAKDRDDWSDRGNPTPGTVVKERITKGLNQDFFLVSHKAIKGTTRPIHYVVLQNEESLALNDIVFTTHYLCYLFGRATRSVGLCTPAYYADLAADRAREYVRHFYLPQPQSGNNRPHYVRAEHDEEFRQCLEIHERIKESMFYI